MYSARTTRTYDMVQNHTVKEIQDPSAPVGIRKEYRWILSDINTNENSLAVYLVSHYAAVWFDEERMYPNKQPWYAEHAPVR